MKNDHDMPEKAPTFKAVGLNGLMLLGQNKGDGTLMFLKTLGAHAGFSLVISNTIPVYKERPR